MYSDIQCACVVDSRADTEENVQWTVAFYWFNVYLFIYLFIYGNGFGVKRMMQP